MSEETSGPQFNRHVISAMQVELCSDFVPGTERRRPIRKVQADSASEMTGFRGSVGGRLAVSPFWVMAKPLGPRCYLDCTYCYYLKKVELYPAESKFRMPPDVLETFVREYIASLSRAGLREIQFVWQGGEPTLLGLDRFRNITASQRRHCPPGRTIRNALQTNGTLLNDEWARFVHDEQFLVGLSLDGPPHLHDYYRRDRRDPGQLVPSALWVGTASPASGGYECPVRGQRPQCQLSTLRRSD
ncbi:radical SAM protein [Mesorhizobium sp. 2RAF21]|uniref:radical SAM protein n=1 Tax=Mesorhizobium sp. 2RAF21 TaxID=3232995 RepID=UPI003F9627AF